MGMVAMRCRGLFVQVVPDATAFHESAAAVRVELFLPYRRAMLHGVDCVAAGFEGLRAMRRTHDAHNGDIADGKVAETMNDAYIRYAVALARGVLHLPDHLRRQRLVRGVCQMAHRASFMVVAHRTDEQREAAAFRMGVQ